MPFVSRMLLTDRDSSAGKVIVTLSVIMTAVDSLKEIVACPLLPTRLDDMLKLGDASCPLVTVASLAPEHISIVLPVLDWVVSENPP